MIKEAVKIVNGCCYPRSLCLEPAVLKMEEGAAHGFCRGWHLLHNLIAMPCHATSSGASTYRGGDVQGKTYARKNYAQTFCAQFPPSFLRVLPVTFSPWATLAAAPGPLPYGAVCLWLSRCCVNFVCLQRAQRSPEAALLLAHRLDGFFGRDVGVLIDFIYGIVTWGCT